MKMKIVGAGLTMVKFVTKLTVPPPSVRKTVRSRRPPPPVLAGSNPWVKTFESASKDPGFAAEEKRPWDKHIYPETLAMSRCH